jgi:hypothetical protein
MNDYERYFVEKMKVVQTGGIDFGDLSKEALGGKFGGAAVVLLRDLSPEALKEPERFVLEMSRIFGRGAIGVFEPIIRYVEMGLYTPSQDSPIQSLLLKLGPSKGQAEQSGIPLHEHRIKDEEGNYPDNAN